MTTSAFGVEHAEIEKSWFGGASKGGRVAGAKVKIRALSERGLGAVSRAGKATIADPKNANKTVRESLPEFRARLTEESPYAEGIKTAQKLARDTGRQRNLEIRLPDFNKKIEDATKAGGNQSTVSYKDAAGRRIRETVPSIADDAKKLQARHLARVASRHSLADRMTMGDVVNAVTVRRGTTKKANVAMGERTITNSSNPILGNTKTYHRQANRFFKEKGYEQRAGGDKQFAQAKDAEGNVHELKGGLTGEGKVVAIGAPAAVTLTGAEAWRRNTQR